MGTSGSYTGSGGADWGDLQDEISDWLDSLPTPDDALTDLNDDVPAVNDNESDGVEVDPRVVRVLRPLATSLMAGSRGRADGPSTGGVGGYGAGGGGRSPSGTGRSRARVGQVGGRLASGVAGIRGPDAAALRAVGLQLTDLDGLTVYEQAALLLAAATEEEIAQTLEEDEVRTAANRTAIWSLTADAAPEQVEVLRHFIVEYVYEVFLTEGGTEIRSGQRDGLAGLSAEQRAHDTIEALARQVRIEIATSSIEDLAQAAETILEQTLRIHGQSQ